MATITEGVSFDTIAREWRCKWSADNDKQSLQEAQKLLDSVLAEIKLVDGCKGVQRVVCITSLSSEKFGDWQGKEFAPEVDFLEKLKKIDGISTVETQTYTLMPM